MILFRTRIMKERLPEVHIPIDVRMTTVISKTRAKHFGTLYRIRGAALAK